MKLHLLSFLILFLTGCFCSEIQRRVFNAEQTKENEFPYLVKIKAKFLCGGALISNRYVLTAAHCLMDYNDKIQVILGDNFSFSYQSSNAVVFREKMKNWIHKNFSMPSAVFDIGIIKLPKAVKFTDKIKPIKLSKDPIVDKEEDILVTMSGWGLGTQYHRPQKLLSATMKLLPIDKCKEFQPDYVEKITDDNICARGFDEKGKIISICDGDSGSPLVLTSTGEVIGIASFVADAVDGVPTKNDCQSLAPNVFTRVASHLKWIQEKTGLKL